MTDGLLSTAKIRRADALMTCLNAAASVPKRVISAEGLRGWPASTDYGATGGVERLKRVKLAGNEFQTRVGYEASLFPRGDCERAVRRLRKQSNNCSLSQC